MKTSFKTLTAAVLFASAFAGFAHAASSNQGDYYNGVDPKPSINGMTTGGGATPTIIPTGEGAYYNGIDRMPQIDRMSTGSIDNSAAPTLAKGGDGEYYNGVNKPL